MGRARWAAKQLDEATRTRRGASRVATTGPLHGLPPGPFFWFAHRPRLHPLTAVAPTVHNVLAICNNSGRGCRDYLRGKSKPCWPGGRAPSHAGKDHGQGLQGARHWQPGAAHRQQEANTAQGQPARPSEAPAPLSPAG